MTAVPIQKTYKFWVSNVYRPYKQEHMAFASWIRWDKDFPDTDSRVIIQKYLVETGLESSCIDIFRSTWKMYKLWVRA